MTHLRAELPRASDVAAPSWRAAEAAARVAAIAAEHAESVDRDGRFPIEAVTAMRAERLMGALVPTSCGGMGSSLPDIAGVCYTLGQACSSSAMVFAMHQIQVACLVEHGLQSEWHRSFLGRVAAEGLLLASITSEEDVGGNMRNSVCAITPQAVANGDGFVLEKRATAISYGGYADAFLVTSRAEPQTGAANQVLTVVPRDRMEMERTGGWNAMGMRGTCTDSFIVRTVGRREQIFPTPFAQIARETMVPVSHLLWCSLWTGIAANAVERARGFLRQRMRHADGTAPQGATLLVEAIETQQMAEARLRCVLARYTEEGAASTFSGMTEISTLKTGISEACLRVVQQAMTVCGFAGYANTGRYSLSRHLRDLHSAPLMVSNGFIRASAARMVILQSPILGIP